MLSKVKLYGDLADFVGHKQFDVKVNSVAQAVSFLINNFPETEGYMSNKYYKVLVNKYEIDETELHEPTGKQEISFVPVITGAGGNVGKVLLGAALIGGAFLFTPLSFANFSSTAIGFGSAAGIAKGVAVIGAGLVLSGVSGMLFPVPKPKEFSNEQDPRISFGFSGIQQSSRAGSSHPIVYGEIFTGSVVISAGIDTEQVRA
mgnify:FL=1|jgi:predicted phage tail protein|tara:strand:+ start:1762 stop:2370 length:609 start_codon:yes stop_codon:yes gene_type:complete